MGVGGQHHAPAALPPGKTRYPFTGGWVGPRAGLDGCGKSRPPPGFDPRPVQPVASRYTDCAIPAQLIRNNLDLVVLVQAEISHKREPSSPLPLIQTFPATSDTFSCQVLWECLTTQSFASNIAGRNFYVVPQNIRNERFSFLGTVTLFVYIRSDFLTETSNSPKLAYKNS